MPDLTVTESFFLDVLGTLAAGREAPGLPDGIEWERLDQLIARHGFGSVFSHYYGASESIPATLRADWKHVLMSVMLVNERALKATVKLMRLLAQEDISAVVLRGLALAYSVYPEPYLRAMQDVDMLVETSAADRIVPCLEKHGLSPLKTLRGQFVYRVDATDIEVHWSLLTPKRYRDVADFDPWLRSATTLNTPHGDIRRLTAENEFIETVYHAFVHHELDTLRGLVDIGRLMVAADLDWKAIGAWCRRTGTGRLCRFTAAYVDDLFRLGLQPGTVAIEARLPRQPGTAFAAHRALLTGRDSRAAFMRRKGLLLFTAERPLRKLRQLVRFFGKREISTFVRFVLGFRIAVSGDRRGRVARHRAESRNERHE